MSTEPTTKNCRLCFEEIDKRARKCPRCLALQGAYFAAVFAGLTAAILAPTTLLLVLLLKLPPIGMPERSRVDHSDAVKVTESRMLFTREPAADGRQGEVFVIGFVRNEAGVPLESLELEVQFFDRHGRIVDVCAARVDSVPSGRGPAVQGIALRSTRESGICLASGVCTQGAGW